MIDKEKKPWRQVDLNSEPLDYEAVALISSPQAPLPLHSKGKLEKAHSFLPKNRTQSSHHFLSTKPSLRLPSSFFYIRSLWVIERESEREAEKERMRVYERESV